MTPTAERVLATLNYDSDKRTASLSAAARGLKDVRAALETAFGEVDALVLSDVRVCDPPPDLETTLGTGWAAVALQGKGRVFGYTRDVYLELGVFEGEVDTLLILIPLARDAWKLSTGFPALKALGDVGGLQLRAAWAAISYGLGGVAGSRTVGERTLVLKGYDLQDGLQLLSDGLVDATGVLSTVGKDEAAKLPSKLRPANDRPPDRVDVRADMAKAWLQVDLWWALGETDSVHATGLALRYDLGDPPGRSTRWLWAIGSMAAPVVLEAVVWPGVPVRYHTRMGAPVPLGETVEALSALLGDGHTNLLPDAPDTLSLLAMTYAPRERFELTAAAGDRSAGGKHIVRVGPVELREVRYTVSQALSGARTPTVTLEGRAAFFGVDFGVLYVPGERIEGGLADPGGLALGRLLQDALGVDLPFGLDSLRLHDAWVRRTLGTQPGTQITIGVDGRVSLLPSGALTLDDVRFRAERPDKGESTVAVGATLSIGPLVMRVDAEHSPDGWLFEGMINAPDGVSLTDLLDHVAHAFGVSIPAGAPDVKLETIAVRYEPAPRVLEVQSVVAWSLDDDIPLLGGEHAVVMTLQVAAARAGGSRQASLSLDWSLEKGAHTLSASAWLSREGQTFSADLSAPGEPLKLSDLLDDLGLADRMPRPAEGILDSILQVSSLSVDYRRPGGHFDLAWTRPLEGGTFVAELIHDGDQNGIKVHWAGGTIGVKSLLEETNHSDVLDTVRQTLEGIGLNDQFDKVLALLEFKQLGFEWKHDSSADELLFQTRSAKSAFDRGFVLLRRGAQAGLVGGLTFAEDPDLRSLPFLPAIVVGAIEDTADLFNVQPTYVMVSTLQQRNFRPPGFDPAALMARSDRGNAPPGSLPFGGAPMPLGKGVAVGARFKLGSDPTNPLRRVVDADHLDGQIAVSTTTIGFQIALPGTLRLNAGGGTRLALGDPMIRVEVGKAGPSISLSASLELMVFHRRLTATGWLSLSTHSLDGHLSVSGFELPPSPMLLGVHCEATEENPLSVSVGLQFEPSGLELGISGSFYIQTVNRQYRGSATFVLEAIEEIVQPLYIEYAFDALDVPALIEAFTGRQWLLLKATEGVKLGAAELSKVSRAVGRVAEEVEGGLEAIEGAISHLNAILSGVSLSDARIRWCDSIVTLPDGTMAMPGVSLRGKLSILGWDAFAVLDVSSSGIPALSGHFEAEPIDIGGVVRLWGDGKGIRRTPKTAEDFNAAVDPTDDGEWYLSPGGVVLHVSTRTAPFVHADLHARLFGQVSADVHADVDERGFSFDVRLVDPTTHLELTCHFLFEDGVFEAAGDFGYHLRGEIGPLVPGIPATAIHLDTAMDAEVELRVDSDSFELTLHGAFTFQGMHLTVPVLTINAPFESLADLGEAMWDHIVDAAEDIFGEVLLPIGKVIAEAAEAVATVATEAVEEVAQVAQDATEAVEQITTAAIARVTDVADDLDDAARSVIGTAEAIISGAAERAAKAAQPLHDQANRLRTQKGDLQTVAFNQVAAIALDVAADVEAIALTVVNILAEAALWAGQRLDEARRWAEDRLAEAAKTMKRLGREAEAAVKALEAEIEHIIADIKHLEHAIEDFANEVAGAISSLF